MKDKLVLTIGGAPEFSDAELASKEIDAVLKQLKKKPKDIKIIYGVGETKTAGEGGYFYAQQWADANGVLFRDGSPKFREHGRNAVIRRNDILSDNSDAFILFVKGTSTGGNGIITAFEQKGIPVYRVEQKEPVKDTADARKIYSGVAKRLLETSVTLDVETTGLNEIADDIVEIAVVDAKTGKTIYNSFIYTDTPINPHAFLVNQITVDMIAKAPVFEAAWEQLKTQLEGKIIIASNSDFDERMVCYGLVKRGLEPPDNLWTCLQKLYCKYSGQKTSKIKTETMAKQLGIKPGTHRALSDAQAQAKILKAMAKGVVPKTDV